MKPTPAQRSFMLDTVLQSWPAKRFAFVFDTKGEPFEIVSCDVGRIPLEWARRAQHECGGSMFFVNAHRSRKFQTLIFAKGHRP